jgi:hypothetical protein
MRTRLLIPTVEGVPLPGGVCRCGREWNQYHAFTCERYLYSRTYAHNTIVRELAAFITRVSGGSVGVEMEVDVPDPLPGMVAKRADIAVYDRDRGVIIYIDVTIVCPTTIGRRVGPGGAAKKREYEKLRSYQLSYGEEAMQFLVPFVVESTGRFGERAIAFMDKLADISPIMLIADDEKKKVRQKLQQNISLIIARYMGIVTDKDRFYINPFRSNAIPERDEEDDGSVEHGIV